MLLLLFLCIFCLDMFFVFLVVGEEKRDVSFEYRRNEKDAGA
jgi:hypothetical protein